MTKDRRTGAGNLSLTMYFYGFVPAVTGAIATPE